MIVTSKREEWRPITGFEGIYEISSFGRVKGLQRTYHALRRGRMAAIPVPEKILKLRSLVGYPAIVLCKDGIKKTCYIHRIVCAEWHGPQPSGCEVAHNDGNRLNANPDNLRWATRRENMADKLDHGTQKRGDQLWFTKVPDEKIALIKERNISSTILASDLGVSVSLISAIRCGKKRSYSTQVVALC